MSQDPMVKFYNTQMAQVEGAISYYHYILLYMYIVNCSINTSRYSIFIITLYKYTVDMQRCAISETDWTLATWLIEIPLPSSIQRGPTPATPRPTFHIPPVFAASSAKRRVHCCGCGVLTRGSQVHQEDPVGRKKGLVINLHKGLTEFITACLNPTV